MTKKKAKKKKAQPMPPKRYFEAFHNLGLTIPKLKPPKLLPMPMKEYVAALDRLGLTVAGKQTAYALGLSLRQCQRLAAGEQPFPSRSRYCSSSISSTLATFRSYPHEQSTGRLEVDD